MFLGINCFDTQMREGGNNFIFILFHLLNVQSKTHFMEFEKNNMMENHDLYVTSQEGIECTKTKEYLFKVLQFNLYTVQFIKLGN